MNNPLDIWNWVEEESIRLAKFRTSWLEKYSCFEEPSLTPQQWQQEYKNWSSIFETLENQGEIDVQRGLGVEVQVSGVHAALRRRVQEAGQ